MTGHRVPQRQIAQFWSATLPIGMRLPPRQIGGSLRGRAKIQVALRDRLPVSLGPRLAEFTAAD